MELVSVFVVYDYSTKHCLFFSKSAIRLFPRIEQGLCYMLGKKEKSSAGFVSDHILRTNTTCIKLTPT